MTSTLFENESAFGGYGYRAVTDGDNVKIEERKDGSAWRTVRTVTVSAFEAWAESVDLYDAYDRNPAKLARYAEEERAG